MLPNGSVPAEGTAQPWEVREHSLKKDIYAEPAMNDCLLGREGHGKSLPGRKDVRTSKIMERRKVWDTRGFRVV